MKRILTAAIAAITSLAALAATTVPPQIISPAGSTTGQAILSTGPSGAPIWGAVSLGSITGVLPIANGGTNASTAATALSNLGGAALTGATFTGDVTISNAAGGRSLIVNAIAGQRSILRFRKGGVDRWWVNSNGVAEGGANAGSNFEIVAYDDAGTLIFTPLTIMRSTGVATFSSRPVFGSATPWDSANLASPASTTGNLGQFASTTSAQLLGVLSDETGSGNAVFSASPTFTGTVNVAALSATSTITPSQTAGIVGTTTNNNANAGSIGEYVSTTSSLAASSSGVAFNAASQSLTAGDWDVQCTVDYLPAGTTTISQMVQGVSTTSATIGALGTYSQQEYSGPAGFEQVIPTPVTRLSLSATTTAYCAALVTFQVSTLQTRAFLRARRVR